MGYVEIGEGDLDTLREFGLETEFKGDELLGDYWFVTRNVLGKGLELEGGF